MNYKFILVLLVTLVAYNYAQSQNLQADVTQVRGTVINANTKEPLQAHIRYESVPYGNRIGVLSGDTFAFNMENQKDYQLEVSADGYIPFVTTLKIAEADSGSIKKVIELLPKGTERVMKLEKLIFGLGDDDITDASYEELNQLANMLLTNPEVIIQLEGHTDFRGNPKQNMKLSQRRVEAVKDYLIDKGISKKRIKTKAFGGTNPLSREDDDASRTNNRRVEVRIMAQ
ncbi:OmpA family protein [Fulvivirga sediminis]|uniref:OmpA family protein n=1 Tax=Fulvivirga sediminis TaxID=2803949 RepID=A0A937K1Y6_9BACT|nr:OmpA family protein [Fulvivirga sediminis]MBL3657820.1 OmpA family protein [Fulvivirga sediminis]